MKPICFKCHRFYRMKKAGYYFVEGMPRNTLESIGSVRPEPGLEHDAHWKDYKLWSGDLWECKGCGHQLISGVGLQPVSEHYRDEFQSLKQRVGATYRVNDC